MEGGIEYGNLGDLRRFLQRDLDAHDVGRIVQRRERNHVPYLLHYRFGNQCGLAKGLAAMHHTMADGKQLRQPGDRSGLA